MGDVCKKHGWKLPILQEGTSCESGDWAKRFCSLGSCLVSAVFDQLFAIRFGQDTCGQEIRWLPLHASRDKGRPCVLQCLLSLGLSMAVLTEDLRTNTNLGTLCPTCCMNVLALYEEDSEHVMLVVLGQEISHANFQVRRGALLVKPQSLVNLWKAVQKKPLHLWL